MIGTMDFPIEAEREVDHVFLAQLRERARELKPCPFCGGDATLRDYRTIWCVSCDCGASVRGERAPEPEPDAELPSGYWERYEVSTINGWNRRVITS